MSKLVRGRGPRRIALASAIASLVGLTLSMPASARSHTIYMVSSDTCQYAECGVVAMQADGNRIRFKMSRAQSGGVGSIGWMRREGNTVIGQVGSDCSKSTETKSVSGHGARTHFVGWRVVSKAQARKFAHVHCGFECGIPEWAWTSPREWAAAYARLCE